LSNSDASLLQFYHVAAWQKTHHHTLPYNNLTELPVNI
jgi:hypothetical protein